MQGLTGQHLALLVFTQFVSSCRCPPPLRRSRREGHIHLQPETMPHIVFQRGYIAICLVAAGMTKSTRKRVRQRSCIITHEKFGSVILCIRKSKDDPHTKWLVCCTEVSFQFCHVTGGLAVPHNSGKTFFSSLFASLYLTHLFKWSHSLPRPFWEACQVLVGSKFRAACWQIASGEGARVALERRRHLLGSFERRKLGEVTQSVQPASSVPNRRQGTIRNNAPCGVFLSNFSFLGRGCRSVRISSKPVLSPTGTTSVGSYGRSTAFPAPAPALPIKVSCRRATQRSFATPLIGVPSFHTDFFHFFLVRRGGRCHSWGLKCGTNVYGCMCMRVCECT